MKKLLTVFLCGMLLLSLSACGETSPAPFDPAADAKALLNTAALFSATLEEVDQSTACALYGIDEGTVASSAVYMANATSAEELAIFVFDSETSAQAGATMLRYRIEDQKEALEDYLPQALSLLDQAHVEVRGNSALLVVAANGALVNDFLEGK